MLHTVVYDWARANATAKDYAEILKANGVTHKSLLRPDIVDDLVLIKDAAGRQAIPTIVAKDIVADFRSDTRYGDVAIFWDIENVRPPSGVSVPDAANAIIKGLQGKFGNVTEVKAYMDISKCPLTAQERVGLQDAKVEVVDSFHSNRKEVADKMIIVDALWYALDYQRTHNGEKPIICLVSGDSDFSPLVSKLSMSGFFCVCIHHNTPVRSLHKKAGISFTWRHFGLEATTGEQPPVISTPPVSGGGAPIPTKAVPASQPASTPLCPADRTDSHVTEIEEDQEVLDLIDAIREAGCGQVRRSHVGVKFQAKTISTVPFEEVIDRAVAKGLIVKGGENGNAWACLIQQAVPQTYLIASKNGRLDASVLRPQMQHVTSLFLESGGRVVTRALFGPFSSPEAAEGIFDEQPGLFTEVWTTNDANYLSYVNVQGVMRDYRLFLVTKGLLDFWLHGTKTAQLCRFPLCRYPYCKFGDGCTFIHVGQYM